MVIMKEAIDLEDWELIDQGKPPRKKVKPIIPEPKFPTIPNRIIFAEIPLGKVVRIEAVRRNVIKNDDGVRFLGYDLIIQMKDSKSKNGWMVEGDLMKLLPHVRDLTDESILNSIY